MITALAFLPLGLAAYFVYFAIHAAPFLTPITRRVSNAHPVLHHWLHCPWCLSPYVAAPPTFLLMIATHPLPTALLLGLMHTLAAACVAGIIGSLLPDDGDATDA